MSALSDFVAQLESGGGVYASKQPASMVDPVYGQYAGFAKQYGSGATGVDNYASQFLAANPNATLGDFYSNYVLGTGSAANPQYTTGSLQSRYPSAYSNLTNQLSANGYSFSTPLSQVASGDGVSIGSGGSTLTMLDPSASGDFSSAGLTDGQWNALPGLSNIASPDISAVPLSGEGDYSSDSSVFQNFMGQFGFGTGSGVPSNLSGLPGAAGAGATLANVAAGNSDFFPKLQASISDWLTRGGIILLGIVLVAAAAWALASGEQQKLLKGALHAA